MNVRIPSRLEVEIERTAEHIEKENEGFIIREVHTSTSPNYAFSSPIAPKTTTSTPSMTIGKALLVLNHSHEDDFIKSVVGDSESLTRKAFLSLDQHLMQDELSPNIATTITISLLDQVVNKQTQQESKPLVLFWWIFMRHPLKFVTAMGCILGSSEYDKSTQLSICLAVIYTVKRLRKINMGEIELFKSKSSIFSGFSEVLPHLSALIQKSNAATRLGVTAANALFCIVSCLGNVINTTPRTNISKISDKKIVVMSEKRDSGNSNIYLENNEFGQNLFIDNLDSLLCALLHMKKWYHPSRELLSSALGDIASTYERTRKDKEKLDLIQRSWEMMVFFLNLIPTKQLQKSTTKILHIVAELQSAPPSDDITYFRVICVALHASILSKKDLLEFFATIRGTLFPVLVNMISGFSNGHEIPTTLLQCALFEQVATLSSYSMKLLHPILRHNIAFSPNTIELLVQAILWEDQYNQNELLDSTTEELSSSDDVIVKTNMINVLIKVLARGCSVHVKNSILYSVLANLDMPGLFIKIRNENLFSELDPSLFIPKLVHALYLCSEPDRSTILLNLTAIVSKCSDPLSAIKILLEICRSSGERVLSPADLGKQTGVNNTDVILNLFSEIVGELDKSFWETGLSDLILTYLASPQDTIMVQFFVRISTFIGQHLAVVLPILVNTMQTQKGLTEELLLSSTPKSEQIIKSLIFERLAPLLVLKVVPYTYFSSFWKQSINDSRSLLSATGELLLTRMTQVYEFEEVRRVSAQVLSYLPPAVWAAPSLKKLLSSLSCGEYYTAKICIFTWFSGLSIQGLELEEYVCQITSTLISILSLSPTKGNQEEALKLQKGATDCLAMIMKASRPNGSLVPQKVSSSSTNSDFPFISFLQLHLTSFNNLLPFILKLSIPPFLLLHQMLSLTSPSQSVSQSESSKRIGNIGEEQTLRLRQRLVESIAICSQASSDHGCYVAEYALGPLLQSLLVTNIHPSLFTSYFQTAVTMVSSLKWEVSKFLDILSDFCFAAFEPYHLRLNGLKLLAAVIIYDTSILNKSKSGTSISTILETIHILLKFINNNLF